MNAIGITLSLCRQPQTCFAPFPPQTPGQMATKREMDAMLAEQQGRDGIVRLKALPVRASADDVLQFLKVRRSWM